MRFFGRLGLHGTALGFVPCLIPTALADTPVSRRRIKRSVTFSLFGRGEIATKWTDCFADQLVIETNGIDRTISIA
jgi:hypothetical protein